MKKLTLYLLITLSTSFIGFGQVACKGPHEGEVFHLSGTDNYCAAIKTDCFKFSFAEQEFDNWCWAACIQMVLHYQGLDITQSDIVIKAHGSLVNLPADCFTTTKAANDWNYNGTNIKAWQVNSTTPKDFIDALAHKYPIIVGLNMPSSKVGHCYVLTAIFYNYSNDLYVPYWVKLRDPWGPNPDIFETSWSDFINRINCIVHVTY